MQKLALCLFPLLLCFSLIHGRSPALVTTSGGTADGSEEWGYVEVRPRAHMFWWLYHSPQRVENGSSPWPTVLWLQAPGTSGVGFGNFQEIGPLDIDLKPRNWTWLQKADLLFVDNPVGSGYSYVEDNDSKYFVKTDEEANADLTTLLKSLYNGNTKLQKSPLFVVGESYGARFAVILALSVVKAIKSGDLNLNFGGIALGDNWISPEDVVLAWGPLLRYVSRLDNNAEENSNSFAEQIKKQIEDEKFLDAYGSMESLEDVLYYNDSGVDWNNFLLDWKQDVFLSNDYTTRLDNLMNGLIRDKLKIIPKDVWWNLVTGAVRDNLIGDFMKPRIKEVDELLSLGVNVTLYNGQLDWFYSNVVGVEAWVQKLKWDGLQGFNEVQRAVMYCGNTDITRGYVKSYKNLHFYWVLGSGRYVPVDQPCIALRIISDVTQSPV